MRTQIAHADCGHARKGDGKVRAVACTVDVYQCVRVHTAGREGWMIWYGCEKEWGGQTDIDCIWGCVSVVSRHDGPLVGTYVRFVRNGESVGLHERAQTCCRIV